VHHIEMDAAGAEEVRRGMIVAASSGPAGPRAADRNILAIAGKEGIYRPTEHLKQATATIEGIGGDPEAFIRSHVRRLEALRRAGHVERIDADHWRVPADLPERGQAYDLARDRTNIRVSLLSPTGLDQQISHEGATWLDRELASRQRIVLADEGFGKEVAAALASRRQWLADKGYASDLGNGRIQAPKDLIKRLEGGDIDRAGKGARRRAWTGVAACHSRQLRLGPTRRVDPAWQRPVRHDRRWSRLQPRSLAARARTAYWPRCFRRRHAGRRR
jgi:hypothetical protein